MFNRRFKISNNNNDNIDFIYANSVVENIRFALISLNYIFNFNDFNKGIYHDEHTFYFFHIQSILTACGNISNVFYNYSVFNGKETTARCARLRAQFNVTKRDFPLIFQKEVRNTNEHFDERYEEFSGNIGDYNVLDKKTNPNMREIIQTDPHLRTYDKQTRIYHTYIRRNHSLQRFEYDLNELRNELNRMLGRITSNPIFDSAWDVSISNEVVK